MTDATATDWGPLSQSIRPSVPEGALPWRDNAFLIFWDLRSDVCGTLHVSTSPNAEGRRARLSVQRGNAVVELVEPLEPGTFASDSITFDGGATFTVDSPGLSGEVTLTPRFALGDYTGDMAVEAFSLAEDDPIQHYQQAATATGHLEIAGERLEIDGHGFRDRTWGFRDESGSVDEYFGCMFVFDDFAITHMKLRGASGKTSTIGFRLGQVAEQLGELSLTRDASGLFAASTTELPGGDVLEVRATGRQAGFWCPMGWERSGPALSAYDEFLTLRTADGREGFGMVEQGVLKRLF